MNRWNLKIAAPFERWVGRQQLESALAANGGRVVNALQRLPWVSVELPVGLDPRSLPGVLDAEPEQPLQPLDFHQATMNFSAIDSWPALSVGAHLIHPTTRGQGVKIAVLDSGFFPHLEFNGADIRTVESVREDDGQDLFGHGTAVLGMLASQGVRILGVAPGATYHIIKVFEPGVWGSSFDAAAGIERATTIGVDIINMSFALTKGFSQAVDEALMDFALGGGLALAGSGNSGESASRIEYPASSLFCLAVGAHGQSGAVSGFSSWGPWPDSPVCIAPGDQVKVALNNGSYTVTFGTSIACPVAAGCLALSLAARPDRWNVSGTLVDPKYGIALPARVARARELLRDLSEPVIPTDANPAGDIRGITLSQAGRVGPMAQVDRDRTGYGLISATNLAESGTQNLHKNAGQLVFADYSLFVSTVDSFGQGIVWPYKRIINILRLSDGQIVGSDSLDGSLPNGTFNENLSALVPNDPPGTVYAVAILLFAATSDLQGNPTSVFERLDVIQAPRLVEIPL